MRSLHFPRRSHFPESCITCKHGGLTSSGFKISWHFTLPAVWIKTAKVAVRTDFKKRSVLWLSVNAT
jgi:hypothetical protein